jgi:outer membrane protein assembly factor BamB
MVSYKYGRMEEENISFNASLDSKQFGDLAIAMAAYSASVKDAPRLDVFGVGVGGSILSEIIKVGNVLYFGGCDKRIYCVSDEGQLIWKFSTNGLNISPTVSDDRLFIGSFDENFYCLSTEGQLLWKFGTNGPIASKPCVFDGKVCFGSKDANVYCLTYDGQLVWKFRTHGPITSDPVYYEGNIYIGSDDPVLYIIDGETGELIRRIVSNGSFGTPIIANDVIYVGCYDKNFYAYTTGGQELWRYKHNIALATRRPLLHDNVLYMCSRDGVFYGITTDGRLYNKYITLENSWNTPVTDGQLLYIGSADGNFYAFDIKTASVVWKFPIKGVIVSTAALDDGVLYFGGWDAHLYAITTKGELLWKFKLDMSSPAAIEPEEEFRSGAQSQVVWQVGETADKETKKQEGEADITDYGTFSGTYIDTSKSDYVMGGSKKGKYR